MGGVAWSVVSNDGVLAESDADSGDLNVHEHTFWRLLAGSYLLSNLFHVPDHKVVALWVVKRGETPGVFECDEMRLLRVVVEVHSSEAANLLSCHLRPVDALLELWRQHCHAH